MKKFEVKYKYSKVFLCIFPHEYEFKIVLVISIQNVYNQNKVNLIELTESQLKFYPVSFSEEVRKGFLDETF